LDALCVVLSEVELVLEEVEGAWLKVEVWGGWFGELVVEEVEEVGWELVPWVGMALSPLAAHLPQSSLSWPPPRSSV